MRRLLEMLCVEKKLWVELGAGRARGSGEAVRRLRQRSGRGAQVAESEVGRELEAGGQTLGASPSSFPDRLGVGWRGREESPGRHLRFLA